MVKLLQKKIQKKNALSTVAVLKSSLPASFPFKGLNSRVVGFTFETSGGQLKEKVDVRGASLSRGKKGQAQVAKYLDFNTVYFFVIFHNYLF